MRSSAFKIVLIYSICGIVWITASDKLLALLEGNLGVSTVLFISSIKGGVYVLITAVMLYKLIVFSNRRLVESETQYRSYFEDNPTPMWIFSRETLRFIAVNDAMVANYGYSREEFANMTVLEIRPAADKERLLNEICNRKSKYIDSGIWVHRRKDQTLLYVQVTSSTADVGKGKNIMVMAKDISVEYRAEIKLRDSYKELQVINEKLLRQKESVLRQNDILKQIAWVESHEIRRPLASIIALIDLIKDDVCAADKMELFTMIDISARELDIMVRKINADVCEAIDLQKE